jgi:hypothetical protein
MRVLSPNATKPLTKADRFHGVSWDEAIRIASALKSWDRPKGLVFVIGIDARSPDDNKVFVSMDIENYSGPDKDKPGTLVVACEAVPDRHAFTQFDLLIRGWFNLGPKGE